MVVPKLTYFDLKGLAEAIRLALTIGDVEFEDSRVDFANWQELKQSTPYGQLPVYEEGEMKVVQSLAILRHVGRKSGMYPTEASAALKVDMILGCVDDIVNTIRPAFSAKVLDTVEYTPEQKAAMLSFIVKSEWPRMFKILNDFIPDGETYFVGGALTVADLFWYAIVGTIKSGWWAGVPADVADSYPKLKAVYDNVHAHPKVQKWNEAHA